MNKLILAPALVAALAVPLAPASAQAQPAPQGAPWAARTLAMPEPIPYLMAGTVNPVSLSCASAGSCAIATVDGALGLATVGHRAWKYTVLPPSRLYGRPLFDGISCAAAGSCLAVGSDARGSRPVAAALSGGSWRLMEAPKPDLAGTPWAAAKPPTTALELASCPAVAWCAAVGNFVSYPFLWPSGLGESYLAVLSGGRWQASPVPTEGLALDRDLYVGTVQLKALSCPVAGSCVAVGSYGDARGHRQGLIVTLRSGRWEAEQAPLAGLDPPASAARPGVSLVGVSCPLPGWCVADGTYRDSAGHEHAFAEVRSGSAWAPATVPAPAPGGAWVSDIACTEARTCALFGVWYAGGALGPLGDYLAHYGGGRWAVQAFDPRALWPSAPQGIGALVMTGIYPACSRLSGCIVAGALGVGGTRPAGFAAFTENADFVATYLGASGHWVVSLVGLAGVRGGTSAPPFSRAAEIAVSSQLDGAACWQDGRCAVVGHYLYDPGPKARTLPTDILWATGPA